MWQLCEVTSVYTCGYTVHRDPQIDADTCARALLKIKFNQPVPLLLPRGILVIVASAQESVFAVKAGFVVDMLAVWEVGYL